MILPDLNNCIVAIIGLGYVGLPLAVEISKNKKSVITNKKTKRKVIGFDKNLNRINQLKKGIDITNEIEKGEKKLIKNIFLTNDIKDLKNVEVFIVTVPTPIDKNNKPELNFIEDASELIGKTIRRKKLINPIIIYESTVFPGLIEEICVPIIKKESLLKYNPSPLEVGFFCGYSPERINPGDKIHKLVNIKKITSGSSEEASEWVDKFYSSFIDAGTYKTNSIRVAEAAKIIENTQRDLNIALINELSIIFNKLNINTNEVLEAAKTKWNFLDFHPGLVGGHCIGVDPYYLTYKSEQMGYIPKLVLAGRKINDEMGIYVANEVLKNLLKIKINPINAKILILGLAFKANCPDIRNTKVVDIFKTLKELNIDVEVFDPLVDNFEAMDKYGISVKNEIENLEMKFYDCLITAVPHNYFLEIGKEKIFTLIKNNGLVYEIYPFLKNYKNYKSL